MMDEDFYDDNIPDNIPKTPLQKLSNAILQIKKDNEVRYFQVDEGQTRSLTEDYVELRAKCTKERAMTDGTHMQRILPQIQSLSHEPQNVPFNPISAINDTIFKNIVWTNADTWNSCGVCGEFFDKLERTFPCKFCQSTVCSKCGVSSVSVEPSLLGIRKEKDSLDVVNVKVCKTCKSVINRIKYHNSFLKLKRSSEEHPLQQHYSNIKTFKYKVNHYLELLEHITTSIEKLENEEDSSNFEILSSDSNPSPHSESFDGEIIQNKAMYKEMGYNAVLKMSDAMSKLEKTTTIIRNLKDHQGNHQHSDLAKLSTNILRSVNIFIEKTKPPYVQYLKMYDKATR
eukprot:TRINITY_DN976_c1_g2_i2.p1 TRINITY_DN976_c1_g2~~TRINITY_DN976_c1_g2_i2.p1  ORF type:complete len:342 (+),score=79.20 TRINITY_DN976_c1_g2_i2:113-1138(+)